MVIYLQQIGSLNRYPRDEMVSFFRPSLDAIVKVVQSQRQRANRPLSVRLCLRILFCKVFIHHVTYYQNVFLVGGFAASPWLYSNLKRELAQLGLTLFRPDSHTYVCY